MLGTVRTHPGTAAGATGMGRIVVGKEDEVKEIEKGRLYIWECWKGEQMEGVTVASRLCRYRMASCLFT